MAAKARKFHRAAGDRICTGVNVAASTVRVTPGPTNRTPMPEWNIGPSPLINSGVIVALHIGVEDRFASPGARMARNAASRTSQATGDETTMATVLERAIVDAGAPMKP